jgi:hypothetical protein
VDILTVESDIVELVEEGALSWEAVARAGLRWISNYDLMIMAQENEWNRNVFLEDDDDDDE